MKAFESLISSLLRFALASFAGWVSVQTGYEIAAGDASAITVLQLVGALVLVGLMLLLKKLDGTKYGPTLRAIIGPRVIHFSHSIARMLVAMISGGLVAWLGTDAAKHLDPDLSDDPAVGVVVVLLGVAFDRVSKKFNP